MINKVLAIFSSKTRIVFVNASIPLRYRGTIRSNQAKQSKVLCVSIPLNLDAVISIPVAKVWWAPFDVVCARSLSAETS